MKVIYRLLFIPYFILWFFFGVVLTLLSIVCWIFVGDIAIGKAEDILENTINPFWHVIN